MSWPVDVFAVMDSFAFSMTGPASQEEMREARAAVAELVEAAEAVRQSFSCHPVNAYCDLCDGDEAAELERLRAALAKFGGEA